MSIMGAVVQVKKDSLIQLRSFLQKLPNVKIAEENDKHEIAIVIDEANEQVFIETIEKINTAQGVLTFNYTMHYSEEAIKEESAETDKI